MIDLSEIRRDAGVTQAQMAERLQATQGAVSQTERRSDLKLSTLIEYVSALDARMRITISVGDRVYEFDLTEGVQP